MYRVLAVISFTEEQKKELIQAAPNAEFHFMRPQEVTAEELREAEVILGNVRPAMLKDAGKLRWVQLQSAGTDGYTAKGALPEGCALTNATGAYGLALAEHLLASLLFVMKKLGAYHDDQKEHLWSDHGGVKSIYGSKTLVVGLGDIGGEFAVRMHALGSRVTGIRRTPREKPDYLEEVCTLDRLDALLPEADIVALALPSTSETQQVISAARLKLMKPTAILLNIGRGNAIDSNALAEALNAGVIGGAAIDVTDPEPLPADHPLWDAKNLLITPHISGSDHLDETFARLTHIIAENLQHYEKGETLRNLVDFETGYRKL